MRKKFQKKEEDEKNEKFAIIKYPRHMPHVFFYTFNDRPTVDHYKKSRKYFSTGFFLFLCKKFLNNNIHTLIKYVFLQKTKLSFLFRRFTYSL